jgi:hypothetical protein
MKYKGGGTESGGIPETLNNFVQLNECFTIKQTILYRLKNIPDLSKFENFVLGDFY